MHPHFMEMSPEFDFEIMHKYVLLCAYVFTLMQCPRFLIAVHVKTSIWRRIIETGVSCVYVRALDIGRKGSNAAANMSMKIFCNRIARRYWL